MLASKSEGHTLTRIIFNTYPWAFGTPGGGEQQILFYHSAIERQAHKWPEIELGFYNTWKPDFQRINLLHQFSCMPSTLDFLSYTKTKHGIPLVISPNFWPDPEGWTASGVNEQINAILWLADKLIVNSFIEKEAMVRLCKIDPTKIQIVPNAVDEVFFNQVDPNLFRNAFNVRGPFVLNIANLEPRKNQLNFLEALKAFPDLQLITIGGKRDVFYSDKCLKVGGEKFRVIDPIPPSSELLRSAIAACEFFAMPSLCETPSIASLEAGAAGSKILTTDLGSPTEYFQDLATYVNPYDIKNIQEAIHTIWGQPKSRALSERIWSLYRWDLVVEDLVSCYSDVLHKNLRF